MPGGDIYVLANEAHVIPRMHLRLEDRDQAMCISQLMG
jgi:hypothetical protein